MAIDDDVKKESSKFVDIGARLAAEARERLTPEQRLKSLREYTQGRLYLGSGGGNSIQAGAPGDWSYKSEEDNPDDDYK